MLISNPGNQSSEKVREARAERESLMAEAEPGQTLREGGFWKDRRKKETALRKGTVVCSGTQKTRPT